jgi:hypothetical protein
MSGQHRLHRPKVERDGPLYLLMFGFVTLVVVTRWLFPHSGWLPIDLFLR